MHWAHGELQLHSLDGSTFLNEIMSWAPSWRSDIKLKIQLCQSICIYWRRILPNLFHPKPIWNRGALSFFGTASLQQQPQDDSNIWPVPDSKANKYDQPNWFEFCGWLIQHQQNLSSIRIIRSIISINRRNVTGRTAHLLCGQYEEQMGWSKWPFPG